jgi:hypothetical protein
MTVAKAFVLVALLAMTPWAPLLGRLDYFLKVERYAQLGIFLLIVAACLIAFLIIPFLRSGLVRIPLVAVALAGFAVNDLFVSLAGQGLEPDQAATLWREKGMIGGAVEGYFWPGLRAAAFVIPAGIVLAWRTTQPAVLHSAWAMVPAAAFAACFAVTRLTLGGTFEFPAPFSVPAMLAVAATSSLCSGPREPLEQRPAQPPQFRNIVMIVDESIRGDYLQINNRKRTSTPFLASLQDGMVNFGPAVAAHNCSAAARLILRSGLRAADLPDTEQRALKKPAIWQFAKQAGFATVYVDAFADVFGTHSYMMQPEHGFIDRAIPVDGEPPYIRDGKIAAQVLPALLAGERPVFVYVNKYGSHFPYRTTYPPEFGGDAPGTADDALDDRERLAENYRRAVRWAVDEFFRSLLGRITLADTLILYTSDHGQSLLEGGYKLSHCSNGKVHRGEGIVPLFALTDAREFGLNLRASAEKSFGKATHFEIFPTLLLAMGYDPEWVATRHGASLLDIPERGKRRFLTGDMFGGNRGARWVEVDGR